MNRKKMLPLVLLAAGAVLLGVLLAVLTCERRRKIPASRWWTLPPRMWTSWPTPATMWM